MITLRKLLEARAAEALGGAWLPVRMTAVLLLVDGSKVWYVWSTITMLTCLGLVFHSFLRRPAFWLIIALCIATWILRLWPLVDNHHYLAGYWSLAILLALCVPDPPASLAVSARWLLALVFLWAALWKGVFSPDFRDGRFFTVRLMSDDRFEQRAVLLSGLSLEEVRANRAFLSQEEQDDSRAMTSLNTTPRFRFWVDVITWFVLAFEAALALLFLLPLGRGDPLRHVGLMLFCVGTFAFAPVWTFGWLILLLGLAMVPGEHRTLRVCYVTVWSLVSFAAYFPWDHITTLIM
jgi:hypothetical protein